MDLHQPLSRRVLLHRGAVAGAAITGILGFGPVGSLGPRRGLAQQPAIIWTCIADGVRVRESPGLAGAVLGVVTTGDTVQQTGAVMVVDGITWLPVTVDTTGLSGWVDREFFQLASDASPLAPGTPVVLNDSGVNLRSGPGLANPAIGTYGAGTTAVIVRGPTLANATDWYEIEVADGARGWMDAAYLSPVAAPAPSAIATTPDWVAGAHVHLVDDGVNMRARPGLTSATLAVFNANTDARVIGGPQSADGHAWYKLGIEGWSGWMAADFLAEGHVGPEPVFVAGTVVETWTNLHLRSGPGTDQTVLATYGPRTLATVVSRPETTGDLAWYQVEVIADGATGWMAGPFLAGSAVDPVEVRLRVIDGPVNLRTDIGTDAPILAMLATGEVVVTLAPDQVANGGFTWRYGYRELDPDVVGWVAADFLGPA